MSTDRPQYGEYATPEEQRARAGLPPLGAEPAASDSPASVPPAPTAPTAPPAAGIARANPVNRVVTIALLAIGLINVFSSIPGFLDLSTTLGLSMEMLGVEGDFSNFASARTWGVIAVAVMLAGYAATVWLAFRRLARGASAWWVPLAGFVVTMLLVSVCVSVPMMGDPAFTQSLLTPPAG
ncbi:DUF6264 family protein [Microbacterium sp. Mu-80]|uniref:DUF6264 family protein n=1 Tax=Microbacterium bandirmense TaxID=3122050 RepID=A0ABU8L7E2_9MICO